MEKITNLLDEQHFSADLNKNALLSMDGLKNALIPFIKINLLELKKLFPNIDNNYIVVKSIINEIANSKLLNVLNNKFRYLPVSKLEFDGYSPVVEALNEEKELPSDCRSIIIPNVFNFPVCIVGSDIESWGYSSLYHRSMRLACINQLGEWFSVERYEIGDDYFSLSSFIRSDIPFYCFDHFKRFFPKKYIDYLFEN